MLLAALPATPVQLVHACYQAGYEVVVPASWGDELVAQAVLEDLRYRGRDPVIQCTCPHVSDRLLANGKHLLHAMVQTAAPPVAAARYARAAFAPRALHITYLGGCPGARSAAIDERYLPNDFLHDLDERGIALADMPTVFDSVLPPDRRRYFSLPGGCPSQEALWQETDGRMLREVTQPTFATDLAQTLVWREHVMIDVAPSLGCACAGGLHQVGPRCGRVAIMALEPPRADQPVVVYRPEFVAPEVEKPAPKPQNGHSAPAASPPAPPPDEQPAWSEPPVLDTATPTVHARARKSTGLPRAYLAKRRRLGTYVSAPEEAAPEDSQAEPSQEPNESEVARPIAVHVEPEAHTGELATPLPQEEPIIAIDLSLAVTLEEPLGEPEMRPETSRTTEPSLFDLEEAEPPLDASVFEPVTEEPPAGVDTEVVEEPPASEAVEEPLLAVEEPPLPEAPTTPLRVEVEIDEEIAAQPADVVIPDSVRSEEGLRPEEPIPDVVTRPVRPWADFLIALWLVLAASAVIASLLWRR